MKNKPIQSIGLTALFEARNSNLNSNESGAPKATAKHTYLSGQKVRYCLFATIDRLNRAEGDRGTMITNGDGINWNIQKDIRADLGGYLITGKKKDEDDGEEDDVKNAKENSPVPAAFLNKRSGPLLVPAAMAINPQRLRDDNFVRFESAWHTVEKATNEQRINSKQYSVYDIIPISWCLDVPFAGCVTTSRYENGINLEVNHHRIVSIEETRRRIGMLIRASEMLTGFANQARFAISNKPRAIAIFFDPLLRTEFFEMFRNPAERDRIVSEVEAAGGRVFQGGITPDGLKLSDMTVSQAVEAAVNFARECEMLNLCEGGATTYDELISRYSKLDDEKKKKAKAARDAKNAKNARDEKKQPGKRR